MSRPPGGTNRAVWTKSSHSYSVASRFIPNGKFTGCDISPHSIKFANELYANDNISFIVDDMSNFSSNIVYDFIVFPDVLEHIPEDQHSKLFENVAKVSSPDAKVLINIPEPHALNWTRANRPEILQIIDQSLSMQDLLNNTLKSNDKYHEWINKHINYIFPKNYKKSYEFDVQNEPQKYIKSMIYMCLEIEKENTKSFQFFPLRTDIVIKFIQSCLKIIFLRFHYYCL